MQEPWFPRAGRDGAGGADLVGPVVPAVADAAATALAPDMPANRALGRMLASCRRDLVRHRASALASDDPEGIHDVRVDLRRLRVVLALFRDIAGDADARAIGAEARELADRLSPARDLQVLLLETVPDAPDDVVRVGRRLVDGRLAQARAVLVSPRFIVFDRKLEKLAASHADGRGEPLIGFARRALDRCEARVRRRGRGLSRLGDGGLHRLRLAAKKLRYAVECLAPVFATRAAEDYAEAAAALQDVLGKMNDRRMSRRGLGDIARASGHAAGVRRSCRRLAKRASRPRRRHRTELKRAWQSLKRAEAFWHA